MGPVPLKSHLAAAVVTGGSQSQGVPTFNHRHNTGRWVNQSCRFFQKAAAMTAVCSFLAKLTSVIPLTIAGADRVVFKGFWRIGRRRMGSP
jgi:hypothetical protein